MKGIVYRGVRLMPGSEAFALYEKAGETGKPEDREKFKKHMARLDAEAHARGDVPLAEKKEQQGAT